MMPRALPSIMMTTMAALVGTLPIALGLGAGAVDTARPRRGRWLNRVAAADASSRRCRTSHRDIRLWLAGRRTRRSPRRQARTAPCSRRHTRKSKAGVTSAFRRIVSRTLQLLRVPHRESRDGIHQFRRNLRQRFEDEPTLKKPGMRNRQFRPFHEMPYSTRSRSSVRAAPGCGRSRPRSASIDSSAWSRSRAGTSVEPTAAAFRNSGCGPETSIGSVS